MPKPALALVLALISFMFFAGALHLEKEGAAKPFDFAEYVAGALSNLPVERLATPATFENRGQLFYKSAWVPGACTRFPKTCGMLRAAIPGNGDIEIRCNTGEPVQFIVYKNDADGLAFAVTRLGDIDVPIAVFLIGPASVFESSGSIKSQHIQTSGTIRRDFSHLVGSGATRSNRAKSDSSTSNAQDYYKKRSESVAALVPSFVLLLAGLIACF